MYFNGNGGVYLFIFAEYANALATMLWCDRALKGYFTPRKTALAPYGDTKSLLCSQWRHKASPPQIIGLGMRQKHIHEFKFSWGE